MAKCIGKDDELCNALTFALLNKNLEGTEALKALDKSTPDGIEGAKPIPNKTEIVSEPEK